MSRITRLTLFASALLAIVLTAPIWSPVLEDPVWKSKEQAGHSQIPAAVDTKAASGGHASPDRFDRLPALTLFDAGWFVSTSKGAGRTHEPALLRWNPSSTAGEWRLPLSAGASVFKAGGVIFILNDASLSFVDERSGAVTSQVELVGLPQPGAYTGTPTPFALDGNRLFMRTYGTNDNLFYVDLDTGKIGEERWSLCEQGSPMQSALVPESRSFVTLCMDLSSGMKVSLSHLFLDPEKLISVDMPVLGDEEYMVGNGFALGDANRAYVVDSDARGIVEVELSSMQVQRVMNYAPQRESQARYGGVVGWFLDMLAVPAHAKRWMAQPEISPDGRYLVVDGGFAAAGGDTKTVWLVDLDTLTAVTEIELEATPHAFHFIDDERLYVLMQSNQPGGSRIMLYNLGSNRSAAMDLPAHGRIDRFLP